MFSNRYFSQRYFDALYFTQAEKTFATPYSAVFDPLLGKLVLHVHNNVNASALDGHDSTYFLASTRFNAGNILSLISTVDGSGSGLDADTLDGVHAASMTTGKIVRYNSTGTKIETGTVAEASGALSAVTTIAMSGQLTNTLAIGTAPLAVTSTTVNANLNADLLDGQHASAFAPVSVISSKTADYPLVAADAIINFTANNCTATLPTAVGVGGKIYNIKNSGTGVVTVATTSSQTIDGAASGSITLDQYDNLTVASDGANWIIL